MIPYSTQSIDEIDVSSVIKALKSKRLTQGRININFENKIAKYTKSKFCLTTNSASSALLLACKSLNLKKNDVAWTVPNTYVATANAILQAELKIDFVDIDINTYNISIEKLEKKLELAKKINKLPKLLIPVHFGGLPCDMKKISSLAKKYNFKIIEDASHALGSKILKKPIGNCEYSDLCVFSFHPVKIITTGEGGAITTNNKTYYKKINALRSGGVIREKKSLINKKMPKWYYEQHYLGYNFRLNEIQAALGISQLKKINILNYKRKNIAKRYYKDLINLPIKTPVIKKFYENSNHLFVIKIQSFKKNRDFVYKQLLKNGIESNVHYIPVFLHPFFKKYKFNKKKLLNSYKYYEEALSIPIYPNMSFKEQTKVINSIRKILK
jgi:UDP-4-amino-4,6-dideoxy-N-acetyl-beta-L-altrosamine transaminase